MKNNQKQTIVKAVNHINRSEKAIKMNQKITVPQKTYKNVVALAVIIILIIIGGIYGKKWHDSKVKTALETEKDSADHKIHVLQEEISDLKREIELKNDSILPAEKMDAVFTSKNETPCTELNQNMDRFFQYLDSTVFQETAEPTSRKLFYAVSDALNNNQPHVSDVSAEVLTLLRSMSHFYRILGKEKLLAIKAILSDEDMLEPAMKTFYDGFVQNPDCLNKKKSRPEFQTLYNYACFFQNTLAGKSYLLRRSSKIRVLTTYYALQIIDKANDDDMNIYGVDIRPALKLLKDDITNHRSILYKKEYLEQLKMIEDKYPLLNH